MLRVEHGKGGKDQRPQYDEMGQGLLRQPQQGSRANVMSLTGRFFIHKYRCFLQSAICKINFANDLIPLANIEMMLNITKGRDVCKRHICVKLRQQVGYLMLALGKV